MNYGFEVGLVEDSGLRDTLDEIAEPRTREEEERTLEEDPGPGVLEQGPDVTRGVDHADANLVQGP
jgi:hypothetical protein